MMPEILKNSSPGRWKPDQNSTLQQPRSPGCQRRGSVVPGRDSHSVWPAAELTPQDVYLWLESETLRIAWIFLAAASDRRAAQRNA